MAKKTRTDNKGVSLRVGEQQRSEDGRYLYRYTDLSGKRRTVYASSIVELRKKEEQIKRDMYDGIDTSKGDMSLNKLFDIYMDIKTDIRESTRSLYLSTWNTAIKKSNIGKMKISKIKQMDIQRFYSGLVKNGISINTIKLYHNLICPALELAVNSDIIRKNPAKDAMKGINGAKKERIAMTISEQDKLLDFIKNSDRYCRHYPMIVFDLSTALRVGELTGLRWSDVDLKENVVHVRRQLIYKNFGNGYKFHIQDLKTQAGRWDIPLTDTARKSLVKQKELNLLLGIKQEKGINGITDFIFLSSLGNPYSPNAINGILDNITKAYNNMEETRSRNEHREAEALPHISAHILRHTACTRLAESGLEPKVLQYIMGHTSISVTMDVYTHLDFTQIQKSLEEVQDSIQIG